MVETVAEHLVVQRLPGFAEYEATWAAMRDFTDQRTESTPDEFWLLEHPPVYTQGQAGKKEHILNPGDIPVVQSDRGGQVTYHGPGQLVGYVLVDLRRKQLGVRDLVSGIEQVVIDVLADLDIHGESKREAPGVYVQGEKIAALGLRVRKGKSFHGLSLNYDLDLEPFSRINPCGYEGLAVTSLKKLGCEATKASVADRLVKTFIKNFGYHLQTETQ